MIAKEELTVGQRVFSSIYKTGTIEKSTHGTVSVKYDSGESQDILVEDASFILTRLSNEEESKNDSKSSVNDCKEREKKENISKKWSARRMETNDPNYIWYNPDIEFEKEKLSASRDESISYHPYHTIEGFCDDAEKALQDEINYVKEKGGTKYQLTEGRVSGSDINGGYIYSFDSDVELNLPDGTEVKIWMNQNDFHYGTVMTCAKK
jgi:hypothetical protein